MPPHQTITTVPVGAARTLLLAAQGLLDDPERRAGPVAVAKIVRQLGFVQVDSIQRVERAHHLIVGARLDDYRATHLDHAAFRKRALFEHWTHDASLIPVDWYRYWKPRFHRSAARLRNSRWFSHRLRDNADVTIARVLDRIAREGPLRSEDFERDADRPATGWWDWTPEKTALEFLWHTGVLAIAGRERFQKLYDLAERVFPQHHSQEAPAEHELIEWACASALDRLGVATPSELAAFWNAIGLAESNAWCRDAIAAGRVMPVLIESCDGRKPRKGVAVIDWKRRARYARAAPNRMRLLAPFDPVLRDRERALRLFGFDYRFEAFVPAKKRKFGYYVLPVLEGDRFVARIDPRHDREARTLIVDRIWWEPKIRPTRAREQKLKAALHVLAAQIGARSVEVASQRKR